MQDVALEVDHVRVVRSLSDTTVGLAENERVVGHAGVVVLTLLESVFPFTLYARTK